MKKILLLFLFSFLFCKNNLYPIDIVLYCNGSEVALYSNGSEPVDVPEKSRRYNRLDLESEPWLDDISLEVDLNPYLNYLLDRIKKKDECFFCILHIESYIRHNFYFEKLSDAHLNKINNFLNSIKKFDINEKKKLINDTIKALYKEAEEEEDPTRPLYSWTDSDLELENYRINLTNLKIYLFWLLDKELGFSLHN